MNIEEELMEGWKKTNAIEQELAEEYNDPEEQIEKLKNELDKLISKFLSSDKKTDNKKSLRIEILAHFCLLSELLSALDFDRMIEIREEFMDLLPNHFKYYLSHLESLSWHISWSGCLSCRHFSGSCNLNLKPHESSEDEHLAGKTCSFWVRRSRKV